MINYAKPMCSPFHTVRLHQLPICQRPASEGLHKVLVSKAEKVTLCHTSRSHSSSKLAKDGSLQKVTKPLAKDTKETTQKTSEATRHRRSVCRYVRDLCTHPLRNPTTFAQLELDSSSQVGTTTRGTGSMQIATQFVELKVHDLWHPCQNSLLTDNLQMPERPLLRYVLVVAIIFDGSVIDSS